MKNFTLNIICILCFSVFTNAQNIKTITTILPFTDEFVEVEVVEKDGKYIFNGDIFVEEMKKPEYYDQLFDNDDNLIEQATATSNRNSLWRGGVVPYVIAGNMPANKRAEILEAVKTLNNETYINIIPRTYQRDFITLRYNGNEGCNSYVGRIGGNQTINVSEWCGAGSIMHEFMHAMGFYHEHNRADRDRYIKINWNNITAEWKRQYQIVDTRYVQSIGRYDFESIMHYPVGNSTFDCYNSDNCKKVGNRSYLSALDINGINTIYNFPKNRKPVVTKPKIKKSVPVFFKTELANDQIFENVYVTINDSEKVQFSVSFRKNKTTDQASLELIEGKEYSYQLYVECTELNNQNGEYSTNVRIGKGFGTFTASRNKELNLYSNRGSTTNRNYTVELK